MGWRPISPEPGLITPKMPSTSTDGKEGWSDQMLAEEEARKAFKSSALITRSPRKKVIPLSLRIPDAPKKATARPMIEENEENDEPSTPTQPGPDPATTRQPNPSNLPVQSKH